MTETRKSGRAIAVDRTNKERKRDDARERGLDETLAETFPASDPLSTDPDPAVADGAPDEKIAS